MALLVQTFCGGLFLSELDSGYFKTKKQKKSFFATKRQEGWGGRKEICFSFRVKIDEKE